MMQLSAIKEYARGPGEPAIIYVLQPSGSAMALKGTLIRDCDDGEHILVLETELTIVPAVRAPVSP